MRRVRTMRLDHIDRRMLLKGAAAVSLGAGISGVPFRAMAADFGVQTLAEDVALVTGAGCNVLLVEGAEGLVMVDGGLAENAQALMEFIATNFGGAPVTALFNTHWHLENTGANEVLGPAGVPIYAQKNTWAWMGAEFGVDWQERRYQPRAPEARPTEVFYDGGSMDAGGQRIEYRYMLQSHTDGDIYVWLPEANVLMAGGVVAPPDQWPVLDYSTGGWIGGMLDGLLTMLELSNEQTRVIGEQGPVLSRTDMQTQYDVLLALKAQMIAMMQEGMGPDDMLAAGLAAEYSAQRGDPTLFVHTAYQGMLHHLRVLGGIIA